MGYGFIGRHRKNEETIFYTSCMYQYQQIFKECFGKEITEFSGRVTKQKISDFENGLENLKKNPKGQELDGCQMIGYVDNISFDKLIYDLYELLDLMKNKKVGYLSID